MACINHHLWKGRVVSVFFNSRNFWPHYRIHLQHNRLIMWRSGDKGGHQIWRSLVQASVREGTFFLGGGGGLGPQRGGSSVKVSTKGGGPYPLFQLFKGRVTPFPEFISTVSPWCWSIINTTNYYFCHSPSIFFHVCFPLGFKLWICKRTNLIHRQTMKRLVDLPLEASSIT